MLCFAPHACRSLRAARGLPGLLWPCPILPPVLPSILPGGCCRLPQSWKRQVAAQSMPQILVRLVSPGHVAPGLGAGLPGVWPGAWPGSLI